MRTPNRFKSFSAIASVLLLWGCNQVPTSSSKVISSSVPALEPVALVKWPGGPYADAKRNFNMAAGGVEITPQGRLWVSWIGGGDSDDGYLLAASSDDSGKTWTKPRLAIDPHRYKEEAIGAVKRRVLASNFWTDPLGRTWLFYDQGLGYFDGRAGAWAVLSNNADAKEPTWTMPRRLFDGILLTKPVVLANGDWVALPVLWNRRVLAPAVFSTSFPELDQMRGVNVFRSRDNGATWSRLSVVRIPDTNFEEPMLVELKDGRLWMLARTFAGMSECFSSDGGNTWTAPSPSHIPNADARFHLRRLHSGNLLLVKNGDLTKRPNGRAQLTAFISKDQGKTWEGGLILDERGEGSSQGDGQKNSGVSYPDGCEDAKDWIYIIYDHNRGSDAEILLARFTEQDVWAREFKSAGYLQKHVVNKAGQK